MILEAKGIKKSYGKRQNRTEVLKGIDLNIEKGEFVSIMGASGSGKTTLLNVLSSIDRVTSGHIFIEDEDMTILKDKQLAEFRKNDLGFMFQEYNLLNTLTVKENILLPLSIRNKKKAEVEEQFKLVAKELEIYELKDKYPSEISGGQQQRTSAARAYIHQPKIIFADEPTGALDSKAANNLLRKLQQLNDKSNSTIMMVTHDATAASYSTRVIFLKDGLIYSTLRKGERSQEDYYKEIMNTQSVLGGVGVES
ncbi:bacitracin transport system ATP-binding protein [Pelagirhabdus alkalitolerans]|uniref:Bacitracin transport system ATP-binding protein n=1 Tax=Pelagirhabdus alkalitolerans TaxID=1612202 RepID=A0A1G6JY72_9BACI|nr:ABC transporter ATP-binding protein [Pelagirhabdus alkalitolerans]SDC23588.1 bacitracin transport system ATP-binding protein [Pelagirhabdus alkalitolerans]